MASKKTSKAVATKTAAGAIQDVPDFMRGLGAAGTEDLGNDAIEVPRIVLVQDQSEVEEVEAGRFMHSITEEDLGTEISIVPIHIGRQFILWQPRHMGGNTILARALDGQNWDRVASFEVQPFKGSKKTVTWTTAPTVKESGLGDWGSTDPDDEDSPPAATEIYAVLCALPDRPDLGAAVVQLQRSQIKVARKFCGKVKMSPIPSFGQIFTMSVVDDSSDQGEFYGYKFRANGLVADEEVFRGYQGLYEAVKTQGGTRFAPEGDGGNVESTDEAKDDGSPEI